VTKSAAQYAIFPILRLRAREKHKVKPSQAQSSKCSVSFPEGLLKLKNRSRFVFACLQSLTGNWFSTNRSLWRRTSTVELRHWVGVWVHLTWAWTHSRALHLSGGVATGATLILTLDHGSGLTLLHGSGRGGRAWKLAVWCRWADLKGVWCHSLTVHAG